MFSRHNKPPATRETPSIIGSNCTLVGDILSQGEVHIDGRVNGDVRCAVLVIGESGFITGEIRAEKVRVLGAVTGQINARAVELAKTARILGDITHESLAVEAGAYVEGRFNRQAEATADQPSIEGRQLLTVANNSHESEPSGQTEENVKSATKAKVVKLGN
ncbi:MAG TPA: polymer-forming cytoskeletal protein [Rhodospirillaceae bacterium]|nr:polymer-forming cytoskeletal protein [Rhodospirillaceae bacterium]